jgi:agmatine/peptidylarginine deiminase
MEGVLIRYPFGISYQIIKEMAEDVEVVTIVSSASDQTYVTNMYQSQGVNLDNCDFLIAPSDSYWTRDYGPWFIFNGEDEQGIVDMIYNRPRPNDDLIPTKFGNWRSIPVYGMSLETTGGNYMTDGQGIAISTTLVWDENQGMTHDQIDQILSDYCGIDTYHVVPDVNGEYIKHIDCWGKYLAPDIIMIREVPSSHPRYSAIESAVDYFESQESCYGTNYNVVRVYTPNNEPYTNSLILNNKVLVPITGSQWDDDAIISYQEALPGYEVLGFTGSWQSTDALHCRVKGIVDREMLYISHIPVEGIQTSHDGYNINAYIEAYSQEGIISGSTGVFYSIGNQSWDFIELDHISGYEYSAMIPAQETGTKVYYYIHAEDESGRSENYPYIGESMAFSFVCELINQEPLIPEIIGPNEGVVGESYKFFFSSEDPEDDSIFYFIDWGDGNNEEWIGPYGSGEEIQLDHIWSSQRNFTISAKVRDIYGYESETSFLTINIPRIRFSLGLNSLFLKLFPLFFISNI